MGAAQAPLREFHAQCRVSPLVVGVFTVPRNIPKLKSSQIAIPPENCIIEAIGQNGSGRYRRAHDISPISRSCQFPGGDLGALF
jgi:hypothetical protein